MKSPIAIALLMLFLGIAGLQNAAANCAGEYTGDYHSLYIAEINHPCPNSYEYAEYNLYGEGDGDFDLYVLDSWNNTWYSSEAAGYNEYLSVPIHCGYGHKAYVWTYNGSGSWSVCSPQITFGEGFQRIADSETAPDAIVATTTTNATESTDSELVGRWALTFDWDCDGNPGEDELIFNSDGSFGDDENLNKGEWSAEDGSIRWEYDEDPNPLYRGSISGLYMSGSMSTINGRTGCWTAKKAGDI
ncbi:MAG: hypothetical protein KBA97_03885 [Methanothrix sp.]|jgi:hypothetical protein|nr:hypothetical protein [Methanothrix sp.]HQJ78857.1 hypothetical protein [Methanothrix sp.]